MAVIGAVFAVPRTPSVLKSFRAIVSVADLESAGFCIPDSRRGVERPCVRPEKTTVLDRIRHPSDNGTARQLETPGRLLPATGI